MPPATTSALVAFGGNASFGKSAPADVIMQAIARLSVAGVIVGAVSPLYQTPCFPVGAGPDYVNAAAVLQVPPTMSAKALLALLHEVEAEFGRERIVRWGARTLDIDLLAFGDLVAPSSAEQARWRNLATAEQGRLAPDELILPHPRMQDRAFVLVPLADVAPDWRHPLLGKTVAEMLGQLSPKDRADVRRIT